MYQDDFFYPSNQDDFIEQDEDKMFDKSKRQDKGYNVINRKAFRKDGKQYNKKIKIYTSNGTGNHIRDAETGEYLNYIVGSSDEDLFFKVMLATGKCTSANGSYTLFYTSPQHYSNHLMCDVNPQVAAAWEKKRDARLVETRRGKEQRFESVEVR